MVKIGLVINVIRCLMLLVVSVPSFSEMVEETISEVLVGSSKAEGGESNIPADKIFRGVDNFQYELSHDGAYVASIKKLEDNNYLMITSIDKKKVVNIFNFGKKAPSDYSWKGNRIIVNMNNSIYELTLDNASPRLLLGPVESGLKYRGYMRWKLLSSVPGKDEFIIVGGWNSKGSRHSTYQYNIYTGELEKLHDIKKGPKNATWYYDSMGELVAVVAQKKGIFEFYNYIDGKARLVERIRYDHPVSYRKNGSTILSKRVHFSAESDRKGVLYITHNLDSDKYKIVEYDVNEGKFGKVVYESSKHDIRQNPGVRRNSRGKLLGIAYLKNRYHVDWVDPLFIELQERLDREFPVGSNNAYSYTDDASVVLFLHDDGARGQDYIYNRKTDSFFLLVDRSAELRDYELPRRKVVQYTARDGVEIESYLVVPGDHHGEPLPFIIMPYSARYGRYTNGYSSWATYFASQGFGVLMVNHRGTFGYGHDFFVSGLENYLEKTTNDIADAGRWAVDAKIARENNVFLFGNDNGGNLALLSSIRSEKVFDAVVVVSAPINVVSEMADYRKYAMRNELEYYTIAVNNDSGRDPYKELSAAYRMSEISQPTHFIYGKKTTFISEKKLDKLFRKSGAVEGMLSSTFIKGEKDTISKNTNKGYVAESAVEFFNQYVINN